MASEGEGPRGEFGLRWLGTRRFWLVLLGVVAVAVLIQWRAHRRLAQPGALVPVVTLSGPRRAARGETLRYAVLVRDRFGAPIPEVLVRVGFWKTDLLELGRGRTGEGGEVTVDVRFPDDFAERRSLVALVEAGVGSAEDDFVVEPRSLARGITFVATDKPLYQPGQTVHLRALAMVDDTPAADRPAVIEIKTEDGIKVFRAEKPSSPFGVVSADFALADQVKLGRYTVAVTLTLPGGATRGERTIEVKRYALPRLTLGLEEISAFTAEGPLRGTARAKWIFGEPVTRGAVTVTLERAGSPDRTVTGPLDKDGAFRFELPGSGRKPDAGARAAATLRARVDVEGGLRAEARQEVTPLGAGRIKLEAFPESGALVAGVTQTVFVVADHLRREGIEVRLDPGGPVARTSERGLARVVVHPPATARKVTLVAWASDGSEGRIELPAVDDALVVQPDREVYGGGETARVRVLGAAAGDRVALRVTRGEEPVAMGACLVAAAETGCESAIALPAGAAGLLWVHALSLPGGKRAVKAGQRLVLADRGSRDLDLRLTPDQAVHAPRDHGSIDVAVTGAGGVPVKAQLGVSVADEAVFALADLRPDLEKTFFTADRDLAAARRGHRAVPLPSSGGVPAQPSAAYEARTPGDVRAAILAALTAMPAAGAPQAASGSEVRSRADVALAVARKRVGAWSILLLAALATALLGAFAWYGAARLRRPLPLAASDAERSTFRVETRGLFADWIIAVLAPPLLAVLGYLSTDVLTDRRGSDATILGGWLTLGAFCAVLLGRAVLRVRRTALAWPALPLQRVLFFLPPAVFLGHLAILLAIIDAKEGGLESVLGIHRAHFLVPIVLAAAVQLTSGMLSVIRQGSLRPVTPRQGAWLLASRACLLGLPFTLLCAGVVVVNEVHQRRIAGWEDFTMEQREAEQVTESNADNKEGGTGTRAKGEEGSMGNPHPGGSRYGVQGPSDVARPPVMRDYFPETLLWAPEIVTDDAGRARVEVPFADSITTWRLAVSAVSQAGQLGSATLPLVVKQDFFVDASLPPTLTQGDEVAVPVTVYSYAEGAQDVTVEIEGEGLSAVGPAKGSVRLQAGETRGLRFLVRADKAGERVLRIKASSPARADAQERKVTVTPNGLEVLRAVNGRLAGVASASVEIPDSAIDGGNDLYLKIYGGPLSQVGEGLDGVFRMPHGCFEQTSSTTYPSVLTLAFLQRTKAVSPALEKKAREYIGLGYQRLLSFEVSGGGFSLFGKSPASPTLTAYGLLEFADLAGVAAVDGELLVRTRDWLHGQRSATGGWPRATYGAPAPGAPDDVAVTAYVAWALAGAAAGQADRKLAGVLDVIAAQSGPDAEDPYALALRASALIAGGRVDAARPLLDRLAEAAVRGDDGVHWTSRAEGVMHSYGASLEVEVTGLAAHALALAGLHPSHRAGALDWLVARRGAHGTWTTTQATIAAMRALLDEARPAPREPQEVSVVVDGGAARTVRLDPAGRDVHQLVSLRKLATTGKHLLELRATGTADVSYQLVARHYVPWQKQAPSALGLDVSYTPASVPVGATTSCRVRLAWRGPEPARMPLVEIAIPPAFEVETGELDALVQQAGGPVQRYTVERGKVTLYLVSLAEDRPLALELRLRARSPARVVAPSSAAYLYYQPEVRAETPAVLLRAL
jgi:hypothetical protein